MGQSQAPRLHRIGVRFCHTHKKEQGSGQRPPPAMARGAQQEGAQGTRPTSYTPTVGTGPRRGVRVKRWGRRWVKPASAAMALAPPQPPGAVSSPRRSDVRVCRCGGQPAKLSRHLLLSPGPEASRSARAPPGDRPIVVSVQDSKTGSQIVA